MHSTDCKAKHGRQHCARSAGGSNLCAPNLIVLCSAGLQMAQQERQRQQEEAQAAVREAAERAQQQRWAAQQAAKREAEALKEAARVHERDALAAVSAAEATCNIANMEFARYDNLCLPWLYAH